MYFEETKEAKLQRIVDCGCTHFLDDLPEFLATARLSRRGARTAVFSTPGMRRVAALGDIVQSGCRLPVAGGDFAMNGNAEPRPIDLQKLAELLRNAAGRSSKLMRRPASAIGR